MEITKESYFFWLAVERNLKTKIPCHIKNNFSLAGFNNAVVFESIDDDDVKYVEDYTRNKITNLILLHEKEPGSFSEEQKVMFFGLYAPNPKDFEYTRGEQKLIAAIRKNIKDTLSTAENREDGLAFFNNPAKGNWWKSLELTSLGFLYNDTRVTHTKIRENTARNDIQDLKQKLFIKAEKVVKTYKSEKRQQLRNFTEHSTFVQIIDGSVKGEIECNFCEENSKKIKVFYQNSSTGYWVISNFEKHVLRYHMETNGHADGVSNTNLSKKNLKFDFSNNESTVVSDGKKSHYSSQTVSMKIEPVLNESNRQLDNESEDILYTQMSKQNIQIINASLNNGEKVLDFYSEIDLENQNATRKIKMCKILGDGGCLYGSMSHQIYFLKIGSSNHQLQTTKMREMCVKHIQDNLDEFKPCLKSRIYEICDKKKIDIKRIKIENEYPRFLEALALPTTFGGTESIKAISDIFKINIVTINKDGSCHLSPRLNTSYDRTVFIGYNNIDHYDSIVEIDQKTIAAYARKLVEDERGILAMAKNSVDIP